MKDKEIFPDSSVLFHQICKTGFSCPSFYLVLTWAVLFITDHSTLTFVSACFYAWNFPFRSSFHLPLHANKNEMVAPYCRKIRFTLLTLMKHTKRSSPKSSTMYMCVFKNKIYSKCLAVNTSSWNRTRLYSGWQFLDKIKLYVIRSK